MQVGRVLLLHRLSKRKGGNYREGERERERERERESTLLHKDKAQVGFTDLSLITYTATLNTSNRNTC